MKAKEAAYYAGMSMTAFYKAVQDGELPKGKRGIGGTYWLRADLERAMLDPTAPKHDFAQKI